MSEKIEEQVRKEVLLKELARDPWLAHCFIKIEDAEKLYCRTALGIACREGARPGLHWGTLPMDYRVVIARFAVETIWTQISKRKQDEWLEIVDMWVMPVYKELSTGDAVRAMVLSENTREMGRDLGVSYSVAHRSILPKLAPLEKMEKLQSIFDTRTPHQKTLAHLSKPKRVTEYRILAYTGYVGNGDECDGARELFYEWLDLEEHPEFGVELLAARLKSQLAHVEKYHTIDGWR